MGGVNSRGNRHSRDGGSGPRAPPKGGATPGENKMPPRLELLLDMPTVHRDTQTKHAWNSELEDQHEIAISNINSRRGQVSKHFREG